ncbi:MAG: hypothetical protein LKJ69_07225 [Lactobacillus sp.]|jgi:hypothetical protein|nr:hypothetical protein [Lactobacillus sp.]MCI2033182.1 hypothetical protein [Lactobacillus sp.]
MFDTDPLSPYWQAFRQSPEFLRLSLYSESTIHHAYDIVSVELSETPLDQWGKTQVETFVTGRVAKAGDAPDDTDNAVLLFTYRVFRVVMAFLAKKQLVAIKPAALSKVLNQLEKTYALGPDSSRADAYLASTLPPAVTGLAQWQAATADDIDSYTAQWVDDYVVSAAWENRPEGVSVGFLAAVVADLTALAYNRYRKTPKSWTKQVLTNTLYWNYVWDMPLEASQYRLLIPALVAWLDWLGQTKRLNATKAANYQRYLQAIEPQFLRELADEDLYAMSKCLYLRMAEAGVAQDDDAAVDAFLAQLVGDHEAFMTAETNAMLGAADTAAVEDTDDDWADDEALADFEPSGLETFDLDEFKPVLNDPEAMTSLAKLFDTDPDEAYLQDEHVPINGQRRWQQAEARRVHSLGVQAGLRLWLRRETFLPPANFEAPEVVGHIAELFDIAYQDELSDPTRWSTDFFANFGAWLRHEGETDGVLLIASMLSSQAAAGLLTDADAQALSAAVRGEPLPSVTKPTKGGGKVISMKQARELLAQKKDN